MLRFRVKPFLAFALAAATGFGIGYLSPRQVAPAPPVSNSKTPPSDLPPAPEETPIDPSWHPGLTKSLESTRDAEAFRQLFVDVWEHSPEGAERDEWLKAIIARWIDVGGDAAYQKLSLAPTWIDKTKVHDIRRFLAFALHRLALTDLDTALTHIREFGSSENPMLGALILERYPHRLLELVRDGKFFGSTTDWHRAGEQLAEAGWEHLDLIEADLLKWDPSRTGSPVPGFLEKIAATDPEGVLAWAARLEDMKSNSAITSDLGSSPASFVRQAAIRALAATDLERAKQVAAEWKDDLQTRRSLAGLIAETDLPGAVDWLVQVSGDASGRAELSALNPALAKLSTAEALSYFERFGAPEMSRYFGNGFHVTSNSPSATYVRSLGETAAPGLAEELAALPSSPARDAMLADALQLWANSDPDAALQKALALQTSENIPGLALKLSEILGRNPAQLMAFASSVPEAQQAQFFDKAARIAVYYDPEPFAAALASSLDQPGAEAAVKGFVTAWAGDGLRAPSEWLSTLPHGAPRDAGINAFVGAVAELEPDSALLWSQSIGDPALRMDALQTSFRPWAQADPAGAQAAVSALTLNEADRRALLDFIQNPTPAPRR